MFDVQVIRNNARKYPQMFESVVDKFLAEAGITVLASAKRAVPVDSGNLRGSLTMEVKGRTAEVGTNVEYAEHIEYGTKFLPKSSVSGYTGYKPYLRPAIDENRKPLIRRLRDLLMEAIRGRG